MNSLYSPAFVVMLVVSSIAIHILRSYALYRRRRDFIESYAWPPGLLSRLSHHHPNLTATDREKVAQGLKQFFRAYLEGGARPVAMPSRIVDDLWHEMILYTRHYQEFCDRAFGRFLHHTPAAVLSREERQTNEALRRTWWHCCKLEGIDARKPARLPILFALDSDLEVPNGYRYQPGCSARTTIEGSVTYCAAEFSSESVDGTTDGLGDGDGDGGDGGGCGGD